MDAPKQHQSLISIISPVFNEVEVLPAFYAELHKTLVGIINFSYEIIFVDDGSTDGSLNTLKELQKKDPCIKILELSRNFGKETALTAGLDFSSGTVVIPIDCDLQDPPDLIPEMIKKWQSGFDVVYAKRLKREGESWVKKLTSLVFYRLISRITEVDIPQDTGDFRLMSRPAVDALKQIRESQRFMKGLFSWIGFKQTAVSFVRNSRVSGKSKWNYWKLWNFALEGITSFSHLPLQIAMYLGIFVASASIFYGLFLVILTLTSGNPVPGYPSLMVVVLFLGGIQLFSVGIIGEYVGRIYNESKRRPLYFIKNQIGFNV